MAGGPWTCEYCGADNDAAAGECALCTSPAPVRDRGRRRAVVALVVLALVCAAAVGATFLFAARHQVATSSPASFPKYTTPVLPPRTTAGAPAVVQSPPPNTFTSTTSPTTTTSPAGKPCPDDTAQYLPGGSGTSLLQGQTAKYLVTVCQSADGQVYYHGQSRSQAGTYLVLPAQRADGGYVAVNGDYRYTISAGRLTVTEGSDVLSDDALTSTG